MAARRHAACVQNRGSLAEHSGHIVHTVLPTISASGKPTSCDAARRPAASPGPWLGYTLIELMLAVLIVSILAELAMSAYQSYRDRTDDTQAATAIAAMSAEVLQYAADNHGLPDSLGAIGRATDKDPWGNVYQYLNHQSLKGNGQMRKDKNIVPINSDFDLYSLGKDGQSQATLTSGVSRDDIVRANNGRFVGLASEYDN